MPYTFTMAEIGQAHDGSLGMAHAYIDALSETGVDAVKFQIHVAEAESSPHEIFRTAVSCQDTTRMHYWERTAFREEQWAGLKKHCEAKGMQFIASAFSNAAVALLLRLGVSTIKVPSGEITNSLLLTRLAAEKKAVILSSGMSSLTELDKAIALLRPAISDLSLLQCTTAYPTTPRQWGLNLLPALQQRYQIPTGFSDHSGEPFACLAATALGAQLLEFHVVFDKRMFGPDTSASLTIDAVTALIRGIRQINQAQSHPVDKEDLRALAPVKALFEKSLAVRRMLPAGHRIAFDDLEAKRPAGKGIAAGEFESVVGRQLRWPLDQWEFLTENDLL